MDYENHMLMEGSYCESEPENNYKINPVTIAENFGFTAEDLKAGKTKGWIFDERVFVAATFHYSESDETWCVDSLTCTVDDISLSQTDRRELALELGFQLDEFEYNLQKNGK